MKKLLLVIIMVMCMLLYSCNMNPIGRYNYKRVHICDFNGNCRDLDVKSWTESEVGIEVKTEEYGSMFLSEGTYIMLSGKCPLCEERGNEK